DFLSISRLSMYSLSGTASRAALIRYLCRNGSRRCSRKGLPPTNNLQEILAPGEKSSIEFEDNSALAVNDLSRVQARGGDRCPRRCSVVRNRATRPRRRFPG